MATKWWIALFMFGIALVACESDDRAKPGDRLTLTFTGKSKSEYFFALENPTSHPIYFRGIKSPWFATIPVDIAIDCKNGKTGEGTVGGLPLFDGGKDPPALAVLPGKAVKLRLKSSASGFRLDNHKGEACQIHLHLWPQSGPLQQGGELVDSQEFEA